MFRQSNEYSPAQQQQPAVQQPLQPICVTGCISTFASTILQDNLLVNKEAGVYRRLQLWGQT